MALVNPEVYEEDLPVNDGQGENKSFVISNNEEGVKSLTVKRDSGDVVISEGDDIYYYNNGYLDLAKIISIEEGVSLPVVEIKNEFGETLHVGGGRLYLSNEGGKKRPKKKKSKSSKTSKKSKK